MYLEKLYLNKNKLKIFENNLSEELFNGKKVNLKYNLQNENFYFRINGVDKLYVKDYFDILNFGDNIDKLGIDLVKFVEVANVLFAKLFDKKSGEKYLNSAADYYRNKASDKSNYIFQTYDFDKYRIKTLEKNGLYYDRKELNYYSSIYFRLSHDCIEKEEHLM